MIMSVMRDIEAALTDAWIEVRKQLRTNEAELRRRLARRRGELSRPIRAWCIAIRANDTRITAWDAAIMPDHALDRLHEDHRGVVLPHDVILDKRLCQMLTRAVDLRVWRGQSVTAAARKLGTKAECLSYLRKHGQLSWDRIEGYARRRRSGIFVWRKDRLRDPCSRSAFDPPDWVWGGLWNGLGDELPDDFEQTLQRIPVVRQRTEDSRPRSRGLRWICPRCQAEVASVFCPLPVPSIVEYLRDEKRLVRCDADEMPPPPLAFACCACHRIRYWSRANDQKAWNTLVAYLSAGLLYGREVRKPAWWKSHRKQTYRPHRPHITRGYEVEKLLIDGLRYTDIAEQLNLKLATIQGHVRRIYKRWNVHSKRELIASAKTKARFAHGGVDPDAPMLSNAG